MNKETIIITDHFSLSSLPKPQKLKEEGIYFVINELLTGEVIALLDDERVIIDRRIENINITFILSRLLGKRLVDFSKHRFMREDYKVHFNETIVVFSPDREIKQLLNPSEIANLRFRWFTLFLTHD